MAGNSITVSDYINLSDRRTLLALLAIPTIALFAGRAIHRVARSSSSSLLPSIVYKAPAKLPLDDDKQLAYPFDALEGARDVATPYGQIRVYEWGPEDGKKVLFIHGISTPCLALGQMGQQLVEEGCRVILFDLFGRGYSDAPDPVECRQDIRLFTSQIMLVLASSPIAWTGEGNSFTLIGYSLGGGIGASFTSYFPYLVDSLVLIAPAGLMRANRFHWSSKLIYGGLLPDLWRNFFVTRRLVGTTQAARPVSKAPTSENAPSSTAPLIPDVTGSAADVVVWQVRQHPGFLPSFISSIRYGPISSEHDRWRLIGSRLNAQKRHRASAQAQQLGLREGKVLIIFGKTDSVVVPEETSEDAIACLGKDNVHIELLYGGHDVPYTNASACVDAIVAHWDGET